MTRQLAVSSNWTGSSDTTSLRRATLSLSVALTFASPLIQIVKALTAFRNQ